MSVSPETTITWNVTNWTTVILMAAVGFFILALIQAQVMKMRANQGA